MKQKQDRVDEINKINELLPKLNYCPVTGVNYWKSTGKRAGCKRGKYRMIGRGTYEHRLNYYREHNYLPQYLWFNSKETDSEGGYNNAASNLREITRSEMNHFSYRECEAPNYKGVYFNEFIGLFYSVIKKKGKAHYLGSFERPEDAKAAYESASKRLYGEF